MNGLFKSVIVGGAAVFVSEFVQGMELAAKLPNGVAKYGGAAAGAWLALRFL